MSTTFGYHATIREFLPDIRNEGLKTQMHQAHPEPVIFFEEDEEQAGIYLEDRGIMLRFPLQQIDRAWTDDGEYIATSNIPAEILEIKTEGEWKPLISNTETIMEQVVPKRRPHLTIGVIGGGMHSISSHMIAAALVQQLTAKSEPAPIIVELGNTRAEAEALLAIRIQEAENNPEDKSKWSGMLEQLDSLFPPEPDMRMLEIKMMPRIPESFFIKTTADEKRTPNKASYLNLPKYRESKRKNNKHGNKKGKR
jgi:hypothetical protein